MRSLMEPPKAVLAQRIRMFSAGSLHNFFAHINGRELITEVTGGAIMLLEGSIPWCVETGQLL
jgi:hypothetical protein